MVGLKVDYLADQMVVQRVGRKAVGLVVQKAVYLAEMMVA